MAGTERLIATTESDLGWLGFARDHRHVVHAIKMGYPDAAGLFEALLAALKNPQPSRRVLRANTRKSQSTKLGNLQSSSFRSSVVAHDQGDELLVDEATTRSDQNLLDRFRDFAAGRHVDFASVQLNCEPFTSFQRKVIRQCRKIPFGETRSYGELAALAGRPGAARAVGTVMAKNRYPIVVPCHRVVAAHQRLGGFSAPNGVELKQRLLANEGTMLVRRVGSLSR